MGGGRPVKEVIFSRRAEPPALILASRRSRRRRICFWAGDSPDSLSGFSILSEKKLLHGGRENGRIGQNDTGTLRMYSVEMRLLGQLPYTPDVLWAN